MIQYLFLFRITLSTSKSRWGDTFQSLPKFPNPTLQIDRFMVACFSNQKRKPRAGFSSPVIVRYCFPYTLHSPCWKHGKRKWKNLEKWKNWPLKQGLTDEKTSQSHQKRYIFRKHNPKNPAVDNQRKSTKMSFSVKPDSLHSPSLVNRTWCKFIVNLGVSAKNDAWSLGWCLKMRPTKRRLRP